MLRGYCAPNYDSVLVNVPQQVEHSLIINTGLPRKKSVKKYLVENMTCVPFHVIIWLDRLHYLKPVTFYPKMFPQHFPNGFLR
jgi:hypothetical protein